MDHLGYDDYHTGGDAWVTVDTKQYDEMLSKRREDYTKQVLTSYLQMRNSIIREKHRREFWHSMALGSILCNVVLIVSILVVAV